MTRPLAHVIDDDASVRESIVFLLDASDIEARGFESAIAFLEARPTLPPGCIVTDIRMPDMSGLELVRRLNDLGSTWPVVVITGHADVPLAVEAMKAGVVDFIEKPFDDERFVAAVRAALAGGERAERDEAERQAVRARIESLSGREHEVLEGLVAGRANKVIAFDLGISPRTVEVYRANVMTKMQANSLSDLVRMSMQVR